MVKLTLTILNKNLIFIYLDFVQFVDTKKICISFLHFRYYRIHIKRKNQMKKRRSQMERGHLQKLNFVYHS